MKFHRPQERTGRSDGPVVTEEQKKGGGGGGHVTFTEKRRRAAPVEPCALAEGDHAVAGFSTSSFCNGQLPGDVGSEPRLFVF